jgi:hypothetical protein
MSKHQKTRFFSVRMTNDEYNHLQLACYKDGLTQSDFIRRHLTNLLKHGNYATNTTTTGTHQNSQSYSGK